MERQNYIYKNAPIPGGGYVTGFLFDEKEEGKLYLRTDIGGSYKFNRKTKTWESLINHVNMLDLRETYPIALQKMDEKLYIISGRWNEKHAKLSISEDEGETFTHIDLPFRAHGNLNGRGTGTHLYVSRVHKNKMYYASQADGLFISEDGGETFEKCLSMKEDYLTFVLETADGKHVIVGSAGVTMKKSETLRGHGLYISHDNCQSFEELEVPESVELSEIVFSGHVPQRITQDSKYVYVTFQVMGPNAKNKELGYSCDNGSVWGGRLFRYNLTDFKAEDITPPFDTKRLSNGNNPMDSGGTFGFKDEMIKKYQLSELPYGLTGVSSCASMPGLLAVSTLSSESGDCIFRSLDYGKTWEMILHDLDTGVMDFRTEYMKPQYNGGHNLIHWMTDLKINPFDPNELWFNTGTGPFVTQNLLSKEVHFSDFADGIEETVHINCYSLHEGPTKLLDIVGDLGGFAFEDLDSPCENSFADAKGNRYITCLNADYSDEDPYKVIVAARGNWTGLTKGGLIYSKDQCKSFDRLDSPFGLSEKIDMLLTGIEKPNVNPGWVSLSKDGENIVWSLADIIYLPVDSVVCSSDGGKTFSKVSVYDLDGTCISDLSVPSAREVLPALMPGFRGMEEKNMPENAFGFKSFSDRMHSDIFYGFGQNGEFYVSTDKGKTFHQKKMKYDGKDQTSISSVNFSFVDCSNKTEVRAENGKSGVFYMALKEEGMMKLTFDIEKDEAVLTKLSEEGDIVYRLGLGVSRENGNYLKEDKAIYISAVINNEYGFYRTLNEGKTYTRLNNEKQMYGEINSIAGDARTYGRFYLATGSRGVLYGDIVSN